MRRMKAIKIMMVVGCLATAPLSVHAQTCRNPAPIHCGDSISDNTNSGSNNIEEYPCLSYTYEGPEKVYLLTLEHGADLKSPLLQRAFGVGTPP
jgi:hypothetical protein